VRSSRPSVALTCDTRLPDRRNAWRSNPFSIQALEKDDPAERVAFLDRACATDHGLRERIKRLLARHASVPGSEAPSALAGTAAFESTGAECSGTIIGAYKLLEEIGESGVGVVYMAEQTRPVRRKVALKILKPGMDTRQVDLELRSGRFSYRS
jgi:hypothetical protein